jgi:hypothetical protein
MKAKAGEALAERACPRCRQVAQRACWWIFGWFFAIWLLGFTVASPLCAFIQLKIGEKERWPLTLLITAIVWAFIYLGFVLLLHLPLPKGQLFVWLSRLSVT